MLRLELILRKITYLNRLFSLLTLDRFRTLGKIDGFNAWNSISSEEPSKRTSTLHNIDDSFGRSAMTVDKWKIVNGTTYNGDWDGWYGPSGDRHPNSYSYTALEQSDAGNILFELGYLPSAEEIK